MSGEVDDSTLDDEVIINKKFENLQKLKFDDQKWELDPTRFIIHHDKVLGQGNFGKVCLATVSSVSLRDEDQVARDLNQELQDKSQSDSSRLIRFSIKRKHNPYIDNTVFRKKQENEELVEPLLNDKNNRQVAVKMVKG